jgi:acyl-CoA reductase-like NAD-dependent aldehyde dehydrogenase
MTATALGVYERDAVLLDGAWRRPGDGGFLDVVSPSTEEVIGRVPVCNAADVDLAVNAARRAFDRGDWSRRTGAERGEVLRRAIALLEPKAEEIARVITSELGQPIRVSTMGVPRGLGTARYFVGLGEESVTEEIRRGSTVAAVVREPVGVVAAIAAWNGPFGLANAKIFPALAAGCSVVFKPAPETPLDIFYIAEALAEAGVPDGVFNLVIGGRETGEALVGHPGVDHVTFTGSTGTGRSIGEVCGRQFKRVQLELGGKSAAIVAEDADLNSTGAGLAFGVFHNSGQVCLAFTRVLAPRSRYDEVVDLLAGAADRMTLGDPFDPATKLGPLVSAAQRDRVESYIAAGLEDGARLVRGGHRPEALPQGYYVEPTVFADADNSMRISREEIFGPVVSVIPYDGIDEAITIANDSDYGLHGGIFTSDDELAVRVARSVRTGSFSVNTCMYNIEAPFGGVKSSGIGRDTGREGFESFLELKTINIPESMAHLFGSA